MDLTEKMIALTLITTIALVALELYLGVLALRLRWFVLLSILTPFAAYSFTATTLTK